MKQDLHPNYEEIEVTCSCGNQIKTRSTLCKDLSIEVCSQCHPFYTGTQKVMDTGGRIERFNKRFGRLSAKK
ncbi:50S ribosomal protein L31 [Endozoicomonas ascidiicola]|uniref:50S ribosomal protein L31 n=1 Tax=Endozoicomonas ascidiicola TaxID=1698521 RepID=UPI00083752D1|nr:50S ribosomal protein L31 [Endozoicomonas ascidiicola]